MDSDEKRPNIRVVKVVEQLMPESVLLKNSEIVLEFTMLRLGIFIIVILVVVLVTPRWGKSKCQYSTTNSASRQ